MSFPRTMSFYYINEVGNRRGRIFEVPLHLETKQISTLQVYLLIQLNRMNYLHIATFGKRIHPKLKCRL
jgi:hypothetical protein